MHVQLVVPTSPAKPPLKSKMFPVLVFLLLACYGIMTLVVVEQGHVIQSQRALIGQLMQDSRQLVAMKGQQAVQHEIEKKQAAANKAKSGHAGASAAPKDQAQRQLSRKSRLEKQPLQADDKVDRRRSPSQI